MSYATDKGLVIGRKYRIKGGDEHSWKVGTIVQFTEDDGTLQPKFCRVEGAEGYLTDYVYVYNVDPVASNGVEFTTEEVKTEVTVIRCNRKLTQAEQDAITAIFNKGE